MNRDIASWVGLAAGVGFAGYQVRFAKQHQSATGFHVQRERQRLNIISCSSPYLSLHHFSQIWSATVQHLELDVIVHKDYRPQDGELRWCCCVDRRDCVRGACVLLFGSFSNGVCRLA